MKEEDVINLILEFRERYSELPKDKREKVCNLHDFNEKCQVEIIRFTDPDFSILIVTHFDDVDDLTIKIHAQTPVYKIVDKLLEVQSDERWNRKVGRDEAYMFLAMEKEENLVYRTLIERALIGSYNSILDSMIVEPSNILGKHLIMKRDFYWIIKGDLIELDRNELMDNIFKDAEQKEKASKSAPESKPPDEINGFGTTMFPSIWIGDSPEPSFHDRLVKRWRPHEKVIELPFGSHFIVVYENGQIGVSNNDVKEALTILNKVCGICILNSIPAYTIRENELSTCRFDSNHKIVGSHGSLVSLRTYSAQDHFHSSSILMPIGLRPNITVDQFSDCISIAEKIDDPILERLLLLGLESYTHYNEAAYMQSFIFSWVLIERFISLIWEDFIRRKDIKGNRKKKLVNSRDWSVSYILEALNLSGVLGDEEYKLLDKMRKRRNETLHEGQEVTKEDAEKALNVSLGLLKRPIEES